MSTSIFYNLQKEIVFNLPIVLLTLIQLAFFIEVKNKMGIDLLYFIDGGWILHYLIDSWMDLEFLNICQM